MIDERFRRLGARIVNGLATIIDSSNTDTPESADETQPEAGSSRQSSKDRQPLQKRRSYRESSADTLPTDADAGSNIRPLSPSDATDTGRSVADGESSGHTITRRPYLKLLGLTATPALARSVEATTETGYGAGGYGNDGYGGGTDDGNVPSVLTQTVTSVTEGSATLTGELESLDGADSARCSFEWRKAGGADWTTTGGQIRTTTGTFSETLDELETATEYEFRAIAETSTAEAIGEISTFETAVGDSSPEPPTVDTYTVGEDSPPNPHAEIYADWTVSDTEGELETVLIEVYADGGTSPLESATTSVDGTEASGSNSFKIKDGGGDAYRIELTVTDTSGGETIDERKLST